MGNLQGEWGNLALLGALYFLQGVPIGLASSVPMVLQARGASFADQATFSLASWPYALKLLWAPLVDTVYTTRYRLGQRKSWVLPTQLAAGLVMIVLGARVESFFGGAPEDTPASGTAAAIDIRGLTASFFALYFLVATQDIAVDGWALTMLRPENVGYASTANTVGQTAGIMAAYGLFMALDSADFSNNYVRKPLGLAPVDAGLVTMGGFVWGCGVLFIIFTLCLWVFKREDDTLAGEGAGASDAAAQRKEVLPSGGAAPLASVVVASSPTDAEPTAAAGSGADRASRPATRTGKRSGRASSGMGKRAPAAVAAVPAVAVPADGAGAASGTGLRRRSPVGTQTAGEAAVEDSRGDVEEEEEGTALLATGTSNKRPAARRSAASASSAALKAKASPPLSPQSGSRVSELEEEKFTPVVRDGDKEDDKGDAAEAETAPLVGGDKASIITTAAPPPPPSGLAAVASAYRALWGVLCLPSVLSIVAILVTGKAWFSVVDNASSLVMQSRGVTKEALALIDVISTPLQLALQMGIARATAGPRPLSLFMGSVVPRLGMGLVWLWLIYGLLPAPAPGLPSASTPILVLIFVVSNIHSVVQSVMFISQMAFFTRVSDPAMGGSYMTLLNTVANIGSMWPRYLALRSIDWVSSPACIGAPSEGAYTCTSAEDKAACTAAGGLCASPSPGTDGFFLLSLVSTAGGVVWWLVMRARARWLETLPREAWLAAAPGAAPGAKAAASSDA